jgi:hypothetical protein
MTPAVTILPIRTRFDSAPCSTAIPTAAATTIAPAIQSAGCLAKKNRPASATSANVAPTKSKGPASATVSEPNLASPTHPLAASHLPRR